MKKCEICEIRNKANLGGADKITICDGCTEHDDCDVCGLFVRKKIIKKDKGNICYFCGKEVNDECKVIAEFPLKPRGVKTVIAHIECYNGNLIR
ncbi:TPA_asm: hp [Altiarchaeum virus]|nr:TPA_asm: hp [Altiarchaeum virus]